MKISIVSGSSRPKFDSPANHHAYAVRHGYGYRFDLGPHPMVPRPPYFKLGAVAQALPSCDWLFWLDDDAFFTDLDRPLETIVGALDPHLLVAFCGAPVNPRGLTTFLNSGAFFIRSCADALVFLDAVR